ncbi:MAG TPA: D-2-hydroxyacid dehydrogenase [Chloroflexota bacterium]|nr:D-2-hydroxyacid dehydrogenase [Chloroflexota bacterium]
MPKLIFLPPQSAQTRAWAAEVAARIPDLQVLAPDSMDDARRELPTADAAFGTLPPDLIARATNLKWLQAPAIAPPAGYFSPQLIAHPVQVTNFRGIFNEHIAAHIMAFVLAFARGLHHYIPRQREHHWAPAPLDTGVVHLPETTALIVGVGGIGAATAPLCVAFGMRVIGIDARLEDRPSDIAELHGPQALDELLPRADFVILTIPHTPETEGLMNANRFARMKRSAFFINIGRGQTTRLRDLDAALRSGQIAGAALDVFEEEPLPPEHPLWDAPNILLTPHTAGFGPYLDDRRLEIILDNAGRFVRGEPLRNIVDKAHWF